MNMNQMVHHGLKAPSVVCKNGRYSRKFYGHRYNRKGVEAPAELDHFGSAQVVAERSGKDKSVDSSAVDQIVQNIVLGFGPAPRANTITRETKQTRFMDESRLKSTANKVSPITVFGCAQQQTNGPHAPSLVE